MKVMRAEHAGACYGVQRALDMADEVLNTTDRVFTLGPLIHNPKVVASLADRGAKVAESIDEIDGGTVVIRSHGVTPEVASQLIEHGFKTVDATCPHVARAQAAAAELARKGCRVLVVGEPGHPEVTALRAYAKAVGGKVDVVQTPDDIPDDLYSPIGVVVQTTQMRENLDAIVDALRKRGLNPEVKNTICSATRQRQRTAEELAKTVDAMVVIGGRNSSNTTRLAEICRKHCENTLHVESADEFDPNMFDGYKLVGVTAGASTPEDQIQSVIRVLEEI